MLKKTLLFLLFLYVLPAFGQIPDDIFDDVEDDFGTTDTFDDIVQRQDKEYEEKVKSMELGFRNIEDLSEEEMLLRMVRPRFNK